MGRSKRKQHALPFDPLIPNATTIAAIEGARAGKLPRVKSIGMVENLVNDVVLEAQFRDHALTGNWKKSRDCHVKLDLVPIYQKPDASTFRLVRLGSHSELGIWTAAYLAYAYPCDLTALGQSQPGFMPKD